jgi:uncharacterized protein (DUF1800 family)
MRRVGLGLGLSLVLGVPCACAPVTSSAPASSSAVPAPATVVVATAAPALALPRSPLTDEQQITHVLNRLGYGPRPGDVERVRQLGVAAYITRQLDPPRTADAAVETAVSGYSALGLGTAQLVRDYPPPAQLRQGAGAGEMTRQEAMAAYPLGQRPAVIAAQLQGAKLTRAVMSERQLQEVMVDFWFNHFNVYAQKGPVRWMLPAYEREAIRPHALGRFRDLLSATSHHPAMLFYLDNWLSTRAGLTVSAGPSQDRRMGLNENYARELMELHTLGVDGGYTQQDVIEVARCFTGWSIDRPQQGGGFLFRPVAHDGGEKRVLGHRIPAGGGESDGERVLDILARLPSTARFIATKLSRRFVSDDPPPALVDRTAATFERTDGDIRAVLLAIFTSPEFWSSETYRAKIKTPLEVVASAVRALNGSVAPPRPGGDLSLDGGMALAREVARLGEPLYQAQPPTGFPDRAEAWVNTGALLGRMNFAMALAHNRLRGVHVEVVGLLDGEDRSRPPLVLERLLAAVLRGDASPATRAVLEAHLESPEITRTTADDRVAKDTDVERLLALVLGSPEFQRR